MDMTGFILAAVPFAAAWVGWVSKTLTSHEEVIKRIDKLVDVLLEKELNK